VDYRYRNITWVKPITSNCLIFAIWYVIKKSGALKAEFDSNLCFWHFYVQNGDKEIHYEQKNRRQIWTPIIKGRIKIYQSKTSKL
jgi:hypothetical protein